MLNDNLLVDDVRTLCPELGPEAPVESGAVVRAGAGAGAGEGTMVEQGKEDQEGKEKEQGSEAAVWPKLHTLYLQVRKIDKRWRRTKRKRRSILREGERRGGRRSTKECY